MLVWVLKGCFRTVRVNGVEVSAFIVFYLFVRSKGGFSNVADMEGRAALGVVARVSSSPLFIKRIISLAKAGPRVNECVSHNCRL